MDGLVGTDWLARELELDQPTPAVASAAGAVLRVVDARWYLDPARRGRDAWRAGHVPGAKSAPWTGNVTADAVPVFLLAAALRQR
jgi:3-mercaptopyruvate sulfurtransferase SseA